VENLAMMKPFALTLMFALALWPAAAGAQALVN
jgi:hypothetical protein